MVELCNRRAIPTLCMHQWQVSQEQNLRDPNTQRELGDPQWVTAELSQLLLQQLHSFIQQQCNYGQLFLPWPRWQEKYFYRNSSCGHHIKRSSRNVQWSVSLLQITQQHLELVFRPWRNAEPRPLPEHCGRRQHGQPLQELLSKVCQHIKT